MDEALAYKDAIEEIDSILAEIENESIDVDLLTEKVKRATVLIKYCKDKLKNTDDEIRNVLEDFEKDGGTS